MRFSFSLRFRPTFMTLALLAALVALGTAATAAERCVLGELFSGDG